MKYLSLESCKIGVITFLETKKAPKQYHVYELFIEKLI